MAIMPRTRKPRGPHSSQANITMRAPAKLNLVLRIGGKRLDGYHEIESLFVPVGLCDTLNISKMKQGLKVSCTGRELPEGPENLVYRAALSFFGETGIGDGARITLVKRIPISSGLGGGSSDAAATLKGLNTLWDEPLVGKDLERLALSLGADVPFFLLQRPAIARGIGELLEPLRVFPLFWYVIVSPDLMVSTAWAYGEVRLGLTLGGNTNILKVSNATALKIPDLLFNDLESVTLSKYPFLCSIKESLLALGALGALMTGSGPSIFGVFESEHKANEAGETLKSAWPNYDVFIAKGLEHGC
jgi:4-diphosphocytidyl-2-C-methyl-D-erythritol kinase